MKKLLGILLTLGIVILTSGCGGGKDAAETAEKPSAEGIGYTAPRQGNVSLYSSCFRSQ